MGRGRRRARSQQARDVQCSDDEVGEGLARRPPLLKSAELSDEDLLDELDRFDEQQSSGGDVRPTSVQCDGVRQSHRPVLQFNDDDASVSSNCVDDDDGELMDGWWGRHKAAYYDANYVDEYWRGDSNQRTRELADMEQREAENVQRKMAQLTQRHQLPLYDHPAADPHDDSIMQELTNDDDGGNLVALVGVSDWNSYSTATLLDQQCPELAPLLTALQHCSRLLSDTLEPALHLTEVAGVSIEQWRRLVSSCRRVLLTFCLNVSYYLSVRSKDRHFSPAGGHPVFSRLTHFARLMHKCRPTVQIIKCIVDSMLKVSSTGQTVTQTVTANGGAISADGAAAESAGIKQRRARGTSTSSALPDTFSDQLATLEQEQQQNISERDCDKPTFTELRQQGQQKHHPLDAFRRKHPASSAIASSSTTPAEQTCAGILVDGVEKRAITYEIAKNKGLMSKRSKASRNPRVKHKLKFQQALKKRSSTMRLPRKEVSKYDGERFGIRMGTVRSIPLK